MRPCGPDKAEPPSGSVYRPERKKARPSGRAFSLVCCLAVYGRRPARHPPGRCCATFKSAPGGFVLLRRALTDRQQIKQKARSFDRA
ncbi:hypothetical protein CFSAN000557_25695, partial [Salmonella enterica subsp. houtenae str. CFSAN000557]|nr:hypothetical protein [Salmonella enterica subsp. houtenae str. CFSAN000557]